MSEIVEVLRLKYNSQLGHAQIARSLWLSTGAVGKYARLAMAAGFTDWPLPNGTDQAALERRLIPAPESKPSR